MKPHMMAKRMPKFYADDECDKSKAGFKSREAVLHWAEPLDPPEVRRDRPRVNEEPRKDHERQEEQRPERAREKAGRCA